MRKFKIPEDLSTVAYATLLTAGTFAVWFKSDAVLHAVKHCYFPFWLMTYARYFMPKSCRDFFYDKVARWRYKLFGRIGD